jgi:hypothetical protein
MVSEKTLALLYGRELRDGAVMVPNGENLGIDYTQNSEVPSQSETALGERNLR